MVARLLLVLIRIHLQHASLLKCVQSVAQLLGLPLATVSTMLPAPNQKLVRDAVKLLAQHWDTPQLMELVRDAEKTLEIG